MMKDEGTTMRDHDVTHKVMYRWPSSLIPHPSSMVARRFAFIMAVSLLLCVAQLAFTQQAATVPWQAILKQSSSWYATAEALRIADNVLLYQRNSGGWPKNIDMASDLNGREQSRLIAEKNTNDSTIDNGATYTQLAFLARVYSQQAQPRHREAFLRGLDFLFQAQYANGGWPQFYPHRTGYYQHITFNDGAMIGVMKLLRDVSQKKHEYSFVDQVRREKAAIAVQKGIDCILKTQLIVDGQRTVWCAQYDEVTLKPAAARKFELVSLSGLESVGIVRFLMSLPNPNKTVIDSIEGAVAWFKKSQLKGIRWIEQADTTKSNGIDRVVVADPNAPPLWARFYEITSNRPMFVGRDGVPKYDVAQIEHERRTGYAWYTDRTCKAAE
jgi:PelA/Pel-15E family pectate lyase